MHQELAAGAGTDLGGRRVEKTSRAPRCARGEGLSDHQTSRASAHLASPCALPLRSVMVAGVTMYPSGSAMNLRRNASGRSPYMGWQWAVQFETSSSNFIAASSRRSTGRWSSPSGFSVGAVEGLSTTSSFRLSASAASTGAAGAGAGSPPGCSLGAVGGLSTTSSFRLSDSAASNGSTGASADSPSGFSARAVERLSMASS
jgi:hypothetical protein